MSYFDDASLVMIPSGYKDQKVYSVKPLDGSGDLTFSRASSATRVASNGLIEKVRTNLALYSEDFTNVAWAVNASPTRTANTTVAPDGTTTADTIASTASSSGVYQVPTVVSGVEYSFSVYVKNITSATNVQIGCDLGPTNGFLNFNAVTGAITSTAAGITGSSVTNVGNGWYRVSGTYVSTGTTNTFIIFGQTGMSFAIWGAQFEAGVTTDYIATTSAAVSVGPVSGLPRLDYLNSTCPRLLLEPQRTNNLTYSEQFNNAVWATDGNGAGETKTANYAISPDGYQDADRIQLNRTGGSYSRVRQDYVASGAHTISVYLKSNTGSSQKVWMRVDGGTATKITITTSWQRFIVSGSTSAALELFIDNTDAEIATIADFSAWGAQLEAGAYATSYIPTLGTSVTRVTDAAYKGSISSLIGQTEGVAYIDFVWNGLTGIGSYPRIIELWGDSNNYIQLFTVSGSANIYWDLYVGGVTQASGNASMTLGRNKIAVAYKANDFVIYKNGTLVTSDTSCTIPATSSLGVAGSYAGSGAQLSASVNQALLFTTRLTNAQLASLTSL